MSQKLLFYVDNKYSFLYSFLIVRFLNICKSQIYYACKNYRGIMRTSMADKLYEIILEKGLRTKLENLWRIPNLGLD